MEEEELDHFRDLNVQVNQYKYEEITPSTARHLFVFHQDPGQKRIQ